MVDREVVLTYDDLMARQLTEAGSPSTACPTPSAGTLIGNAWWSGVRTADLLREAGVQEGADAVLQTSDDGWNCGTPLSALTDDRDAMLTVAMNGEPLPIEHGFPVRTLVPGLYGYVSACKWVVDMEVTRFEDISAYWTSRGWAEQGPVKMSSRIDVPRTATRSAPARCGSAASPGRSTPGSTRSRSPSTAAPGRRPRSATPTRSTAGRSGPTTAHGRQGRPRAARARHRRQRPGADRSRGGRASPTARPGGTRCASRRSDRAPAAVSTPTR